jgi:energy-coupling factor transporter ATP-binding protein EcfA2
MDFEQEYKYVLFKVDYHDNGTLLETGAKFAAHYRQVIAGNPKAPIFRSIPIYPGKILEHFEKIRALEAERLRESGRDEKSAKGSIAGYADLTWCDHAYVDIDCKKDGPQAAMNDGRALVVRLRDEFGVDPDFLHVYFSGSKGFHIYIPQPLIGFGPSTKLHHLVHKFVNRVCTREDKLIVQYDPELYKSQMNLRLPWSIHEKSGYYKVPIAMDKFLDELFTIRDVQELAKKQIKAPARRKDFSVNEKLAKLWPGESELKKARVAFTSGVDSEQASTAGLPIQYNTNQRMCMTTMMHENAEEGQRNAIALILASHLSVRGDDPDMVRGAMAQWYKKQTNPMEEKKFWSTVEDGIAKRLKYSCENEILAGRCDKRCFMYEKHVAKKDDYGPQIFMDIKALAREYKKVQDESRYIGFGIEEVNRHCYGVAPGEVVLIYGRTMIGKTTFANHMANTISKQTGKKILFLQQELGAYLQFQRSMAQAMNINPETLANMYAESKETGSTIFDDLVDAAQEDLSGMAYRLKSGLTTEMKIRTIESFKETHGAPPAAVFEDYLGRGKAKGLTQTERIAQLASNLKDIALACDVPYFCLVQISRKPGEDHTTPLSIFSGKDSSEIENVGDYIFGIHRPDFYAGKKENYITFQILKNRRGEANIDINLRWDKTNGTYWFDPSINKKS